MAREAPGRHVYTSASLTLLPQWGSQGSRDLTRRPTFSLDFCFSDPSTMAAGSEEQISNRKCPWFLPSLTVGAAGGQRTSGSCLSSTSLLAPAVKGGGETKQTNSPKMGWQFIWFCFGHVCPNQDEMTHETQSDLWVFFGFMSHFVPISSQNNKLPSLTLRMVMNPVFSGPWPFHNSS